VAATNLRPEERIASLEAEVEALRRELERERANRRDVIDRYEYLLAEARSSSPRRRNRPSETPLSHLLRTVRR
jgi:hypothetical protein